MQVELEIKFKKTLDWQAATLAIREIVGENAVAASAALVGHPVAQYPSVVNSALAAERILNVATIVYFREGSDAIRALIVIRSLSEAKRQCARIARQVPARIGTLSTAIATIQVPEGGTYEALMAGERTSIRSQMLSAVGDSFVSKIVPSAVTFALASYFLSGTEAVTSAAIGLGAAAAGTVIEAAVGARASKDWKWKELS